MAMMCIFAIFASSNFKNTQTTTNTNNCHPLGDGFFVPTHLLYLSGMEVPGDEYFMQQALKEAQKAYDADEVPVGAVVVQDGKIIARGHNQVELLNDATAHAEILAITSAFAFMGAKYLPDATLYVTLEPCLMCAGALYWSKIGRVVFGAYDVKNGYQHITKEKSPFHVKTELLGGVLEADCSFIIQSFFRAKR
jgi:tRNA(adenine34) deaminase